MIYMLIKKQLLIFFIILLFFKDDIYAYILLWDIKISYFFISQIFILDLAKE